MSPPAPVAEVARAYGQHKRAHIDSALSVLQSALRRGARSPEAWRTAVIRAAPALLAEQAAVADLAEPYLQAVLPAQGTTAAAEARVNGAAFADLTDGGGSWMRNLLFSALSVAQQPGLAPSVAMNRANLVAMSIVLNGMQDVARASVQAGMFARPRVATYVRMLNGRSCARCALLAGRVYRRAEPFDRHPRCDCLNVPSADAPDDWAVNPSTYFRSLSTQDQDRLFTSAGARVIRDSGVDDRTIGQVVNAREGVQPVTATGRLITTTGTTVRGTFGGYEVRPDGSLRKRAAGELERRAGSRYRSARQERLMPEEIYRMADQLGLDRSGVLGLLRQYAYVI